MIGRNGARRSGISALAARHDDDDDDDTNFNLMVLLIFTNPSAQAGYDTRLIFKRGLTGLNSEFSFS